MFDNDRMKPILFSTPMVRAILDDRKTMTRRVINRREPNRDKLYKMVDTLNGKPFFGAGFYKDSDVFMFEGKTLTDAVYYKARYRPGDIIWVRETWDKNDGEEIHYRADEDRPYYKWRPSIFMPREAARLFLRVTDVRAERLQEITEADALAEGVEPIYGNDFASEKRHVPAFAALWDALNAKRGYGWDTNPWVWVYTFERNKEGTV